MKNNDLPRDAVRFPSVNDSIDRHGNGYRRRDFLKIIGTAAGAAGLVSVGVSVAPEKAQAFAYEPYYTDDQLTTVVTSCAHNCGSRHVLVAHKKGDVIVRLSTDNGEYQAGGAYGKDTLEEPQLRACLRGRSYRARLYSPERLLYPMKRVGARGEHKFKRITWDEALNEIAQKMVQLKKDFGPTAILDQSYAGASYGVLHKSDQIEGLLGRFLGMFGCCTNSWSVPSYQGTTFSSRMTFGTIQDGNEDDAFAHSKLIIMWGWNPAYSDWFNQLTNINKEIKAIDKLELVVCMDSTITPSGIWADYLLPIATHFERHDVALPWYKGHYYIHRPKVIEPLGESKTDFQVFTEMCYRLEQIDPSLKNLGQRYNPRAQRDYFQNPDAVDEAYLKAWWEGSVQHHQHVTMSWDEFKQHGTYKFKLSEPHVAFRDQVTKGVPFETASGKIEIFSTYLAGIEDWTKTQFGYEIPYIPKWIEPFESLNHPITKDYPFHLISPHPRWRTHSIFNNIPWLRETYEQEVTINASDAKKLGILTGDTVEVWNERGKCVVPAYVTERLLPGVLVLFEGAWMDPDKDGVDRAGNPDFLTLDNPSPAGAFAYNNAMVQIRKTDLVHRPGWDDLAVARSSVFRRDM